MKITASGPITSCQIDEKQWKQLQTLFSCAQKITEDDNCSHEIKRPLLLGRKKRKREKPRQSIIKQIHRFAYNGP